jgi:GNAT superfamily N-acetyltransferase
MIEDLVIEPMTGDRILWRCLHQGPLTLHNVDLWPSNDKPEWECFRERNLNFLRKVAGTYGACAIQARDGEKIVGLLRFYPKILCGMHGATGLCLMQEYPAGPGEDFVDNRFPPREKIGDRTLTVHCLMTGSSMRKENPYQRRGIGTLMAEALIRWAGVNGWKGIEVDSFEDVPIIYEITGAAGHSFWEKLGFRIMDRHPHPELQDGSGFDEFIATLEDQSKAIGIPAERARDRLVMRLDIE